MGWTIEGSNPERGKRLFSFPKCRLALDPTQPPAEWVLEVKQQGREANHSLTSSVSLKDEWDYASTRTICIYDFYQGKLYLLY